MRPGGVSRSLRRPLIVSASSSIRLPAPPAIRSSDPLVRRAVEVSVSTSVRESRTAPITSEVVLSRRGAR